MTLATIIKLSDFASLVEGAYHPEIPTVSESESELGEPLQHFGSAAEIQARAEACYRAGVQNFAFGLWYPSMKGRVLERRVDLDPPREGKSFRHSLSGWGVIHLRLYVTPPHTLQCRVVVNSESRATARQDRHPELGPASEWDWRVVETYAFRLSRKLASMGRTAPVVQLSSGDD